MSKSDWAATNYRSIAKIRSDENFLIYHNCKKCLPVSLDANINKLKLNIITIFTVCVKTEEL